jgi:hypothetical protein
MKLLLKKSLNSCSLKSSVSENQQNQFNHLYLFSRVEYKILVTEMRNFMVNKFKKVELNNILIGFTICSVACCLFVLFEASEDH